MIRKKHINKIILGVLCTGIMLSTGVFADNNGLNISSNGTLIECNNISGELVIPSGVKKIGKQAFKNSNITKVKIPSTVKVIDRAAFEKCANLKEVEIEEGLESILGDAFKGCINLTKINIPSTVKEIGYDSFYNCVKLSDVDYLTDTDNVENNSIHNTPWMDNLIEKNDFVILNGTLLKCTQEKGVVKIPSNVKKIASFAISGREITDVIIPDGVTIIGEYAFSGRLETIHIPDSVIEIKNHAFSYCDIESIKLPSHLKYIAESLFFDCDNLKSIEIPDSVTEIKDSAFYGCDNLENVKLSKNLKTIGDNAFYNCSKLTKIDIPNSVTSIGERSFNEGLNVTGNVELYNKAIKDYKDKLQDIFPVDTHRYEDGWHTTIQGEKFYKDGQDIKRATWFDENGKRYYFYSNGKMATGFIKLADGVFYYLDPSTGALKTGWQYIDNKWYYFSPNAEGNKEKGCMKTGWLNNNGNWYYFYSDGSMATGFINLGGDAYYYLDESSTSNIGIMKTGWQKINGYWYYFNKSGEGVEGMMKKGWQYIGGKWYYFYYSDGKMAANTYIDGYYVNSSGAWVK